MPTRSPRGRGSYFLTSPLMALWIVLFSSASALGVYYGYSDAVRALIGIFSSLAGVLAFFTYARLSPLKTESSLFLEAHRYTALAASAIAVVFILLALGPIGVPDYSLSAAVTYFFVGSYCSSLMAANTILFFGSRRGFLDLRVRRFPYWFSRLEKEEDPMED